MPTDVQIARMRWWEKVLFAIALLWHYRPVVVTAAYRERQCEMEGELSFAFSHAKSAQDRVLKLELLLGLQEECVRLPSDYARAGYLRSLKDYPILSGEALTMLRRLRDAPEQFKPTQMTPLIAAQISTFIIDRQSEFDAHAVNEER